MARRSAYSGTGVGDRRLKRSSDRNRTFQAARDSGDIHLIRTSTYRRKLPLAWCTRVVEHTVRCDGEDTCAVVSSRELAYGHQHDVQEYLRLRCPVMLASADAAVASHWRESCRYRREPHERTK